MNDAYWCPDHPNADSIYTDPTGGDPFIGGPIQVEVCEICWKEVVLKREK